MAKIIVLQHVPFEILGTMNALFKQQSIRIKYVNFGRHPDSIPNINGYDGMVVLGGPMGVDEVDTYPHLRSEVEIIQQGMEMGMPILGICLGAQLIAKAAGGIFKKNPSTEIGWYDITPTNAGTTDPLIKHFNGTETIFQWHSDSFELPPNAIHLASSDKCENQAFRIGDNIYGLQFHLEVDEPLIERWLTIPLHVEELKKLKGEINPEQIRTDTQEYIAQAKKLSNQVFGTFSKLIGHQESSSRLRSR